MKKDAGRGVRDGDLPCQPGHMPHGQKKFDEAGESLKKSEELFASLPGDPHADSMLATRGQLEYMLGRFADAAGYYRRAAETLKNALARTGTTPGHAGTAQRP